MNQIIGIIGAMDEEIQLYRDRLELIEETHRAGITYYKGVLNQKNVVLCKSGVGKVNASICTQILIDDFQVTHVIFTGVAGGVDPLLNIGDIVISEDCIQHDLDVTALGFRRGEIPYADVSTFVADAKLIQIAQESGESIHDVQITSGRILSGDQFIADRELVQTLYTELKGACVEMEGAAVAQVCFLNQIPFVVIRSLSDKADGSAHINFLEFTKLASQRSFHMVEKMLTRL